jgi:hypothetical protein
VAARLAGISLFAAMTLALAADSSPAIGGVHVPYTWYAMSKDGSTNCKVNPAVALCQVKAPWWRSQVTGCPGRERVTVGFGAEGDRARFSCRRRFQSGETYDPHTFLQKGHIRCDALRSGFGCVDRERPRRSFLVTRSRYSLE